jgi:3-hydroxy-9,10-secoandrosta-1,3,5(10)-triene-9,17-dione monooxygenase
MDGATVPTDVNDRAMVTSRQELLRRAAALRPVLGDRAQEAEALRRIPEATVDDLRTSGLLRIANPSRYGGPGLDYDVVLEVAMELGRACGSTAWCYTVWSSHNWLVGFYPERAQEEYFGPSPDVLSSSAFNAGPGRAEPAPGGYRLSGHWDFSSGCDAATWALLAAATPDRGPGLFLVPLSACQIVDTWFASGLRGTGSKDVVLPPTFVPGQRFLSYGELGTGHTPGRDLHDRLSYRLPVFMILPFTLAAPLIGIAQGALDAFEERLRGRVASGSATAPPDLAAPAARLAEASAEVDCARLIVRRDLADALELAAREEQPTVETRLRYRRDHGYVATLCVRAVNRLFEAGGGHAILERSPLQRAHRDVHAGSHHVILGWDGPAEQYGRVRCGLEPTDARI